MYTNYALSKKIYLDKFSQNLPYCVMIKLIFAVALVIYFTVYTGGSLEGYFDNVYGSEESCVKFDSKTRLITIACGSTRLSDIDKQIDNSSILKRESLGSISDQFKPITSVQGDKIWILSAGIIVGKNATLVIDSTDTTWLKKVPIPTVQLSSESKLTEEQKQNNPILLQNNSTILSSKTNDRGNDVNVNSKNSNKSSNDIIQKPVVVSKNNDNNPNGIHVYGSLIIDSVKITSWDPKKNDVVKFKLGKRPGEEDTKSEYDTVEPRPFIRVSNQASGTTNITNSELAYLGYSCSKCSGLSYYGGIGSVVRGNDIHHLLKGFYSNKMGYMIIENNNFHDNYLYGIDPHTGTHDLVIRNNKVHHNNATAVVCAKDCYNILIEGNEVYNNLDTHRGIAFSINSDHSIAQNNYVHDQDICIGINRFSDFDEIYNNTLSNCNTAIDLTDTSNNIVHNNKILGAKYGVVLQNVTNKIFNNKIYNSTNGIVLIHTSNNTGLDNVDPNNKDTVHTHFLDQINTSNEVKGTKNPITIITNLLTSDKVVGQKEIENKTKLTEEDDKE